MSASVCINTGPRVTGLSHWLKRLPVSVMDGLPRYVEAFIPAIEFETAFSQISRANAEVVFSCDRWQRIEIDVTFNPMPGKCSQCGSRTYLGRTTVKTNFVEIQNIRCTVCQECGQETVGQQVQKKIDTILERAAKGKLKARVVVM
jgi:uncharacterized protein YlaI